MFILIFIAVYYFIAINPSTYWGPLFTYYWYKYNRIKSVLLPIILLLIYICCYQPINILRPFLLYMCACVYACTYVYVCACVCIHVCYVCIHICTFVTCCIVYTCIYTFSPNNNDIYRDIHIIFVFSILAHFRQEFSSCRIIFIYTIILFIIIYIILSTYYYFYEFYSSFYI